MVSGAAPSDTDLKSQVVIETGAPLLAKLRLRMNVGSGIHDLVERDLQGKQRPERRRGVIERRNGIAGCNNRVRPRNRPQQRAKPLLPLYDYRGAHSLGRPRETNELQRIAIINVADD